MPFSALEKVNVIYRVIGVTYDVEQIARLSLWSIALIVVVVGLNRGW